MSRTSSALLWDPAARHLSLVGDFDAASASGLACLLAGVADGRVEGLRLDLSSVDFMDAAGASALVGVARAAAARGVRLSLEELPPHLARLLRLTGDDRILDALTTDALAGS
ncbi:MAG: STAS domain-containing protein [Actinobacteria bacterium]|nr:STAS domain-containing protein [Actinomycetota bacterium]